ncbi:hypothetical protein EV673_1198 [Limnobacter thiooxidans]|uniref:Uncharacterized protein n=1 Tax=Limnobacter thiooxidans TaxID=131080 RepID=A0AA86M8D5_9BURK|nr:hypothetical protein EV673_1198 [Limnobacter thiooxidans]BET25709.1 hypothetical protein RGQ30_12100 [Limnobacter thiooxidans]
MSLNSISGNQPVQGQPQLNREIQNNQSPVSQASREIGTSLMKDLPRVPLEEASALAKPVMRLYAMLSNLTFRFKSFFSPGSLTGNQDLPFPFKLSYQIQSLDRAEGTISGHPAFEVPRSSLLARIAHTRQGLVQIQSGTEKCLGSTIWNCLRSPEFEQGIALNDDQKIVGCYKKELGFRTTQWCLQVYDSSEGETVEVPITVFKIENQLPEHADEPEKLVKARMLLENLADIKVAMDSHLEAIHPAYRDSVMQPMVLCDSQPQLANLVVAQEELLSRLYSGQCTSIHQMDMQIDEVLHMVSPERTLFESKEEQFSFYANVMDAFENHHTEVLTRKSMAHAHEIRASRRHMPVPDFPINTIPLGVVKAPVRTKPETPTVVQRVAVQRLQADVSPPTLEGKSPLTRPSLLTKDQADPKPLQAYREPLKQAQCSVNAVNTFFQNEIVTSEKMASLTIKAMKEFSGDMSGITGLGRPEILEAIEHGESITIEKSAFLAAAPSDKKPELNLFDHTTPKQQWEELINVIKPLGPGKEWVNNKDELNGIQELTITPSAWLSAYAEVGLDMVTKVVKETLETRGDNPDWSHLPEDVDSMNLDTEDKIAQFAEDIQANVPVYMNLKKELSLIVLVGSGGNSGNHFYTISYNKESDSWISLDSDRTEKADVQPCKEFCNKDTKLKDALLTHRVKAIVVPKLYVKGDNLKQAAGDALDSSGATDSSIHTKAD